MRKLIILIVLAVAALTGCSQTEGEPTAQPSTTTETDPTELPPAEPKGTRSEAPPLGTGAPAPEPVDTPEPEQPLYGKFGGVGFTFDDGVIITVGAVETFEPAEYAFVTGQFETYILFDVTVTNGADVPFDPSGIYATLASGGTEGEAVYDSDAGLEGQPMTTVLPGKSVTWTEGWGVADPADLTFQIAPGFEYEEALFVGGL